MGIAKSEWIAAEERGWSAPDKNVCAACVEDSFIKDLIQSSVNDPACDYCGKTADIDIAAPVAVVVAVVAEALYAHFAEPAAAGLPRDSGDWVGEGAITDTCDALLTIGFSGEGQLFQDVEAAFSNDAWYPCADGHWMGVHEHEELRYGWTTFEHLTKHKSRYFFDRSSGSSTPGEKYSPISLLYRLGELVDSLGLITTMSSKTRLFRVRETRAGTILSGLVGIGPPPESLATAGRMNPAGICYFYLGLDEPTALAEVLGKPPCFAAIGEFELNGDLLMLDLTDIPPLPSIFDGSSRDVVDATIFLNHFVRVISSPISKDGQEHIDYVPSQIVSEYFAQVYEAGAGERLSGIVYPSSVRPGGKNVVLFPPRDFMDDWSNVVRLVGISHQEFATWGDLKRVI